MTAPLRRSILLLPLALAATALLLPAGCYRKVVDAQGIGSASVDVHEPDNPEADRSVSKRKITPIERQAKPFNRP